MDVFKVVGELPAEPRGRKSSFEQTVEQLRAHPGQWCLVREYQQANTAQTESYRFRCRVPPGFRFVARTEKTVDGGAIGRVYGRYDPPAPDAAQGAK